MKEHRYCVYMVMSSSRRALYIGMTNNLERRIAEHKTGAIEGFTADYNADRLVYWESLDDVRNAIDREKQLKGWTRAKKEALIRKLNPAFRDMSADWGTPVERPSWAMRWEEPKEPQGPSTRDRAQARPLAQDDKVRTDDKLVADDKSSG